MRILHVIPSLAERDGGPTKAALEMCGELLRRGEHAEIYTTNADGRASIDVPTGRRISVRGVAVTYFPIAASNYYKISPQLGSALKAAVTRFDVVHIDSLYQFPSTIAAYYCRRYGVPYVIRPHGTLDPFLYRRHRLRKWAYETVFERRNLLAAAAVQFTSTEEMMLASSLGLRFRGLVAPLGVNFEGTPNDWELLVDATWPELAGKEVVLFLGRINFKKGLDILAQAYTTIRRQRKNVQLVIAGPDNDGYSAQVREWFARADCLSSVTFTGMVRNGLKAALLKRARVFVLPSYTENFGIAVVEAMGAGIPVAISNRVNIWREVQDAAAGLVAQPDADQFAKILMTLLDDPGAAEAMGERGYRFARTRFSWERAGDGLLAMYREAAAAHR